MLLGELSLAAFGEWLASESWNMFADSSEDEAIAQVAAINIRIDAYDDGAIDAASFRRELLALLNDSVMLVQFDSDLRPIDQPLVSFNAERRFASSPHPQPVQVFHLQPA
jgi:hypothetical protein